MMKVMIEPYPMAGAVFCAGAMVLGVPDLTLS